MTGRALAAAWLSTLLVACSAAPPQADEPSGGVEAQVDRPPGEEPVAASVEPLFGEAGVRKVQHALQARGFNAPASGELGAQTRMALLAFQKREGIAETSLPDMLTLERLGLDPEALYAD